jgi:signal transduction histidine kinase
MTISKDKVVTSISKAKADLEQALADLEHLPSFDSGTIAFAAHALSNFLAVINGTTELLLLSLKDYDEVRVRNGLEGLRHAAGLMIHTVNQLMNTSAQSNPRLIHDNVNFALLVERACQYYQGIAARKRIGIVFSSAEVPNAWTDRVAVAAVLDNLLSNAVKYSLSGTRIMVTVRHESAGLVCRVQDEGPGISREDQAKLFQRGVRLSALPTGGEPSTGYGLSVAKELVDNLGGKIWCESELGKGACFCFQVQASVGEARDSDPNGPVPPLGASA